MMKRIIIKACSVQNIFVSQAVNKISKLKYFCAKKNYLKILLNINKLTKTFTMEKNFVVGLSIFI